MKKLITPLLILLAISGFAQKKVLDHPDFEIWNRIQNQSISNDGAFIMYSLEKGEKDSHLKIKNAKANLVFEHERGERGQFSYDSKFAFFTIKAWQDSVMEMRRRKVKRDELPKDSLAIFNLSEKSVTKIGMVKSYQIPEKWSGYVAYQLEYIKPAPVEGEKKKTKEKKAGKDNGYHLVLRNLATGSQDTIPYVTDYVFAKAGKRLAYATTGIDSLENAGVYVINLESNETKNVLNAKGEFSKLSFSETGKKLGYVADLDTTKALIRPYELHYFDEGTSNAIKVVDQASAPGDYLVSNNGNISFSKDETRLFFGLATPPVLQDTSLLSDEIVDVEVWTYDEPMLYTMQEQRIGREKRRTYLTAINLDNSNKLVQLGSKEFPTASTGNEGNASFALVRTTTPYEVNNLWEDVTNSDYALVNIETGDVKNLFSKSPSWLSMSPSGKYLYGYNPVDTTWFTYNIATEKLTDLTKGKGFADEINDRPSYASPYGIAGWTENDASVLIYDRYDIWEYQPENANGKRLTDGRNNKTVYRYVRLDDEERFIKRNAKWLLTTFNEGNKNAGYYEFNGKNNKGKVLVDGPYRYSRPRKAQQASKVIFTRQSFIEFPDIRYADIAFKSEVKISTANPQQSEYNWGTAEIVKWTSLDGLALEGLLIKPENFDPNKKYPMIVNYYEKSSNGLHSHRAPYPGRSTISYSFYASRGYVIFNPDIYYRVGYPGESAYNCLVPGVTSLLETGYIDKDNIGLQGHSWGGYQNAYLITKTDLFKAAEIGAPVPNMISAYGGIRWGTGRSRISQYEHGQSRIGGTPWEYPIRYIENSPIFFADKINTPSLIMHNDADTAVPWYQGIEFFMALRRLGKPAWLLNYNGEPHWPVKLRNRKDFNIRMAQFFDYYLQGAPIPVWMDKGVPALEKGINQGYELKK